MRSNRNVPSPWCRIQYQKRRPGLIGSPTPLPAPGDGAPHVDEFVGLIKTGDTAISIAHTRYSAERAEPGKCPKFEEFTIVRKGMVHVEHADGVIEEEPARRATWSGTSGVRYSTPAEGGAEIIAVCMPAFSRSEIRFED